MKRVSQFHELIAIAMGGFPIFLGGPQTLSLRAMCVFFKNDVSLCLAFIYFLARTRVFL